MKRTSAVPAIAMLFACRAFDAGKNEKPNGSPESPDASTPITNDGGPTPWSDGGSSGSNVTTQPCNGQYVLCKEFDSEAELEQDGLFKDQDFDVEGGVHVVAGVGPKGSSVARFTLPNGDIGRSVLLGLKVANQSATIEVVFRAQTTSSLQILGAVNNEVKQGASIGWAPKGGPADIGFASFEDPDTDKTAIGLLTTLPNAADNWVYARIAVKRADDNGAELTASAAPLAADTITSATTSLGGNFNGPIRFFFGAFRENGTSGAIVDVDWVRVSVP